MLHIAAATRVMADCTFVRIVLICCLQDAALKVLETARSRHNFTPEARHVNYVVAAYARAGNLIDAAGLTDAAGSRGWGRDAGSFNALLAGLVQELRQVVGGGEEPSDTLVTE
jgi:hypothetical protein